MILLGWLTGGGEGPQHSDLLAGDGKRGGTPRRPELEGTPAPAKSLETLCPSSGHFCGSIPVSTPAGPNFERRVKNVISTTGSRGGDYRLSQKFIRAYTHRWLLILGAIYILTIFFAPRGLWNRFSRRRMGSEV